MDWLKSLRGRGRYPETSEEEREALSSRPPKVSVVLPTHNGTRYLAQSVRSIIDQTVTDWELIVVDDCSTEDVYSLVRSFNDARIHYVRNAANFKLPRSLNRGFALASGEYLTWTSDDNWYVPHALQRMSAALDTHEHVDLVYANYRAVDEFDELLYRMRVEPAILLPEFDTVGACFLYRRNVMRRVGLYNPNRELVEDYEYWLRVHNQCTLSTIDEDLYYYRLHTTSLTGTNPKARIEALSEQARRDCVSARRKLDLRAYRSMLRISEWTRSKRFGWALLPVRFANGCLLRRYQRDFYVTGTP